MIFGNDGGAAIADTLMNLTKNANVDVPIVISPIYCCHTTMIMDMNIG